MFRASFWDNTKLFRVPDQKLWDRSPLTAAEKTLYCPTCFGLEPKQCCTVSTQKPMFQRPAAARSLKIPGKSCFNVLFGTIQNFFGFQTKNFGTALLQPFWNSTSTAQLQSQQAKALYCPTNLAAPKPGIQDSRISILVSLKFNTKCIWTKAQPPKTWILKYTNNPYKKRFLGCLC